MPEDFEHPHTNDERCELQVRANRLGVKIQQHQRAPRGFVVGFNADA
jgi:hypothetical protein